MQRTPERQEPRQNRHGRRDAAMLAFALLGMGGMLAAAIIILNART